MDHLSGAQKALDRGEWQLALDLLESAGPDASGARGLELQALARYGNGDFEASVSAWEELHTLHASAGNNSEAARSAAMVAMFLMMDTGLMAPVRGWLRRADRLLGQHDHVPAHAVIAMVRCYERFMCGDMEGARQHSALAIELGGRLDVPAAVVIGRVCAARVTVFAGRVDEGLSLLDEIALDLMSGAVDPLTTGMMYCELICAAQGMALHDKANEWTEVMEQWSHGAAIGGIRGRCRIHRAEMLRVTGPCDRAEEEALGACDELRPWMRREFGWPLVELGNIRLRRGDHAGAEEAFMSAHARAWSPQPGLALLRLEQGDVGAASAMIDNAIAHPFDIPSKERPPFGDLRMAPLLDAQVEIATAASDSAAARGAAEALVAIAGSYPSRSLHAGAALATARAALLVGDIDEALHESSRAVAAWADIDAPYESARARMVLGDAHQQAGNTAGARMEWQAAMAAFRTFGASRWAERAEGLLSESAPAKAFAPEDATVAKFTCHGDIRTVSLKGQIVTMRDLVGFRYLERLLADPGREFHVLDLVAVENGTLRTGRAHGRGDGLSEAESGRGIPLIDDTAREAYRRRLAEVDDDIDEATRMNDPVRVQLAQRDRDYLIAELSSAIGLGGRNRTSGGTSERARTSVTRSIRYAIGRLKKQHAALGAHIDQSVQTGTYCSYSNDPLSPIVWEV